MTRLRVWLAAAALVMSAGTAVAQDAANITFDTGVAPCYGQRRTPDATVAAPELVSLETSDTPNGSAGALKLDTRSLEPFAYGHMPAHDYNHTSGAVCPLSSVVPAGTVLRVQFSAKAADHYDAWVAVTRLWGGGGTHIRISRTWQRYTVFLTVNYDTDALVFSPVLAEAIQQNLIDSVVLFDDIRVSVVLPGESTAPIGANVDPQLSYNTDFEVDTRRWLPRKHTDAWQNVPAPELMSHETADTFNGSQGALRVTITKQPGYQYQRHTAGAFAHLAKVVPVGATLRVRFAAKSVSGSPWIGVWGGGSADVLVTNSWQTYEVSFPVQNYPTAIVSFTVVDPAQHNLVEGSALIDNVEIWIGAPPCSPGMSCAPELPSGSTALPIGEAPPAGYDPGPIGCGPALSAPAAQLAPDGQYAYESVSYVPAGAPGCHVPAQFCDANNNPVPTPSEAELNAPPAPGSGCNAIGQGSALDCAVDPATLMGPCTSDAQCASGEVCRPTCADTACTSMEQRCGRLYASCAGIPADGASCEDGRLYHCPDPRDVGQVTPAEVTAQTLPEEAFDPADPTVFVPEAQRLKLQALVQPTDVCAHEGTTLEKKERGPRKAKNVQLGNDKWGIYWGLEAVNRSDFSFWKKALGAVEGTGVPGEVAIDTSKIGPFEVGGSLGLKLGAKVFGFDVKALTATGDISVSDCKTEIGATIKIFGEAIAVWNPSDGVQYGLDAGKTPTDVQGSCNALFTERNNRGGLLKKAMFTARGVRDFTQKHGLTRDLCERSNRELGTELDCSTPDEHVAASMIQAWDDDFKKNAERVREAKTDFEDLRRHRFTADFQIPLYEKKPKFLTKLVEVDFPISFLVIKLAADGYGFWGISGRLGVGVGFDGQEFQNNRLGGLPATGRAGDTRIVVGPTVTPEVGMGVQAFAGVGVPGVSIGIEGRVEMIRIGIPLEARAGMGRYIEADARDIQAVYPGTVEPGLDVGFVTRQGDAYGLGASLDMHALDGNINLAARVRFFFFKKTFRYNIFSWKGVHHQEVLFGKTWGAPIIGGSDIGVIGPDVAYTLLPPIGDAIIIPPPDPKWEAKYPDPVGEEDCLGILI